jgi:bifunctional non-homologous end joining protein LigD
MPGRWERDFTEKIAVSLRKQLDLIAVPKAPIEVPRKRDTTWVQPKLIAKVEYRDITDDGMLRHPSFKGLVNPGRSLTLPSARFSANRS